MLFGFKYNGSDYYYIRNVQNDITGIIDVEGIVKIYYLYDSWGKLISITGDYKDTVGLKNPFRYRGYYYDNEIGFYYLNSRYYDPEIGRFINPDIIMGTGDKDPMAYNLFLYCNNNPVNRQDPSGRSWGWISGWIDSTLKSAANWFIGLFRPQSSSNGAGGGGGGSSWGGDSSSADIGHAVFEVGTTCCFDGALDFAKSPITTQIAVKSFSKGLKVGPIAAMLYANDIRLNYEQYAGNDRNIAIANTIDSAVLLAGVGVGALLAMSALPVVAVVVSAIVIGVAIGWTADQIENRLIE